MVQAHLTSTDKLLADVSSTQRQIEACLPGCVAPPHEAVSSAEVKSHAVPAEPEAEASEHAAPVADAVPADQSAESMPAGHAAPAEHTTSAEPAVAAVHAAPAEPCLGSDRSEAMPELSFPDSNTGRPVRHAAAANSSRSEPATSATSPDGRCSQGRTASFPSSHPLPSRSAGRASRPAFNFPQIPVFPNIPNFPRTAGRFGVPSHEELEDFVSSTGDAAASFADAAAAFGAAAASAYAPSHYYTNPFNVSRAHSGSSNRSSSSNSSSDSGRSSSRSSTNSSSSSSHTRGDNSQGSAATAAAATAAAAAKSPVSPLPAMMTELHDAMTASESSAGKQSLPALQMVECLVLPASTAWLCACVT